jgi:hypothetical protein
MFTSKTIIKVAFLIATICVLQIWLNFHMSSKKVNEALDKIHIIWPDFMELSQEDRVLIKNAAYNCNVYREYPLPGAVKDCLRVGAMQMDAELPKSDSLKRLDSLLADARN